MNPHDWSYRRMAGRIKSLPDSSTRETVAGPETSHDCLGPRNAEAFGGEPAVSVLQERSVAVSLLEAPIAGERVVAGGLWPAAVSSTEWLMEVSLSSARSIGPARALVASPPSSTHRDAREQRWWLTGVGSAYAAPRGWLTLKLVDECCVFVFKLRTWYRSAGEPAAPRLPQARRR